MSETADDLIDAGNGNGTKRAERLQVLADASRAFVDNGLDLRATLRTISRLVGTSVGDGCVIRVLAPDGQRFAHAIVYHPDPDQEAQIRRYLEDHSRRDAAGLGAMVLASGRPFLSDDPPPEAGSALTRDELVQFVRSGIHAGLVAPLAVGERLLGTFGVWRDRTPEPFDADDRHLLLDLAARVAIMVDHARAYDESRSAEQKYRLLFDHNPEACWVFDIETLRYLAVNDTALERYGYTRDEFLGMILSDLRLPEDVPLMHDNLRRTPRDEPYSLTVRHLRKDGSLIVAELASHPIEWDGRPARLVVATDVTARRRTEEQMRDIEARYRMLVEGMPGVAYIQRPGAVLETIFISPAIEDLIGYTPEECTSNPTLWIDILHPDDRDRVLLEHAEASSRTTRLVTEYREIARDGRVVWLRDELQPALDEHGGVQYWHGILVDVTEHKQAEEALQRSETRYRALVDTTVDAIITIDMHGIIASVNAATEPMFGYQIGELIGTNISLLMPEPHHSAHDGYLSRYLETGESHIFGIGREVECLRKDGSTFPAALAVTEMRVGDERTFTGIVRNITAHREAEERLRQHEQRFESLVRNLSDIIVVLDRNAVIQYVSPSLERVMGWSPILTMGEYLAGHTHRDDADLAHEFMAEVVAKPGIHRPIQLRFRHADDSWRVLELRANNLLDDASVGGVVIVASDITDQKRIEEQLARQAFFDTVTGLPNRALFMDRLTHVISRSEREQLRFAVMFFDIDNFKVINDSLGHAVGDDVLVAVAQRLEGWVRPADTVARFAGDEFTILLEGLESPDDAQLIADRVLDTLRVPFTISGRTIYVSASIGIAISDGEQITPEDLLRDADVALYRAKSAGKSRYDIFDPHMRQHALDRLNLENDLRRAVDGHDFDVVYQPQIDLRTSDLLGFEGLVRWSHPERGTILPGEFIELAEETGLIIPIGEWVLRETCRQMRAWLRSDPDAARLIISVNLSARQFQLPSLVSIIAQILEQTGLAAHHLVLEITETAVMGDIDGAIHKLLDLKRLGVRLAVDDFGTGYSSLAHLKRFPVDYLKIARPFIEGLGVSAKDTLMVSGMIALAHAMDVLVVAEGVETARQAELLREFDCDVAQGFYFRKPLPPSVHDPRFAGTPRSTAPVD